MAISKFTCPECGSTLKTTSTIAAGAKIKCPKCATIFPASVQADSPTDEDDSAPAPRAKKPVGFPAAKTAPARRPAPPKEEFAEYDDDDDDTEEDRPRRKKKKRQTSNNLMLMLGIGGLVLLLAGGAIGAFVWPGFLRTRMGEEPLAFVPANSTLIVQIDIETMLDQFGMTGAQIEQAVAQIPPAATGFLVSDCKKETGLEIKELFHQVTFASNSPLKQPGAAMNPDMKGVIVIKSKVPFEEKKVLNFFKLTDSDAQKLKGKTYYKKVIGNESNKVFLLSNRLILIADLADNDLEPILAANGTKPAVTGDTMQLIDLVRPSQAWVVLPVDASMRQQMQQAMNVPGPGGPEVARLKNVVTQIKGVGVRIDLDNNQIKINAGVLCPDGGAATQAANDMQQLWNQQTKGFQGAFTRTAMMAFIPQPLQPFANELINNAQYTSQGPMAQFTTRISIQSVKTAVAELQKLGPGAFNAGGMPGGPAGIQPPIMPGRGRPGRPPRRP